MDLFCARVTLVEYNRFDWLKKRNFPSVVNLGSRGTRVASCRTSQKGGKHELGLVFYTRSACAGRTGSIRRSGYVGSATPDHFADPATSDLCIKKHYINLYITVVS